MLSKVVILSLLGCFLRSSSVAGILTTNINDTNGVLTVCPGEFVSITCSHDNSAGITRWVVSGTTTADCLVTVSHVDDADDDTCGLFTITMISGLSGPTFDSTAQTTATEALNGAVVQCFFSARPESQVGNVTINVLGIPTPSISSVEQVSQSMVRVNMTVNDTQCVDSYHVNVTGGLRSTNTTSPTPTVDISDLDVCQYNYTFVGSVLTAGGVQSELSTPMSFSADLSVVNGITVTINQEDPLIEWVQMDNPLYPTCIIGYYVDSQTGLNTTAPFTARSLTARQLNTAGFPYCISIHPTVTPITSLRPLMTVSGNESMYTNLIDPDFPSPILSREFPRVDQSAGVVVMRVNVQNVSESVVTTRNYQYTTNNTVSPMMNFSGDYFVIELPLAVAGQMVTVTVVFQNGPCQEMSSATYTVPSLVITNLTQGQSTDTSHTITITLPLTEYQPEQLLIISTVEPTNDGPTMANYTLPSMQYTVTFTDLDPATDYTFTIRIVLRSNNTVDVVPAVNGTFMTLMMTTTTPPPTTMPMTTTTTTTDEPTSLPTTSLCNIGCIIGIIVAVVLLIVLVLVVVIIIVIWKSKRSKKVEISHELEDQPKHKLTAADGGESDPGLPEPPSSDVFKSPTPEDTKSEGTDGASGATGGEKENLIYADLDLHTKGKKPKPQDAPSPTGVAGKEEDVQYATITPTGDKKEKP